MKKKCGSRTKKGLLCRKSPAKGCKKCYLHKSKSRSVKKSVKSRKKLPRKLRKRSRCNPIHESYCIVCGGSTTYFANAEPKRTRAQMCAECFEVSNAPYSKRMTCMNCDRKRVLRSTDLWCKPCREAYEAPPRTSRSIARRADRFEPKDPMET